MCVVAGRLPPWSPGAPPARHGKLFWRMSSFVSRRHTGLVTTDVQTCSARGCRRAATWALQWNNPKIHPPERRKTWLACEEHRTHLTQFLTIRGFLRETNPISHV